MFSQEQAARNWAFNLARLREKKGWSRYELAKQAGIVCNSRRSPNSENKVNTRAITLYERGKSATFEHLLNLADALDATTDALLKRAAPADFELPRPKRSKKAGKSPKKNSAA